MDGDADISVPAALMGDPARSRLLLALADGRALPASVLAVEAGVAASTCSEHLGKLRAAGMVAVETHGRNRYYRIDDPYVVQAVEALARIAPCRPVTSLRQGTRAHALRRSRLCYDHLAGSLGVALMRSLIDSGAMAGGDGTYHASADRTDRLSAPGRDVDYHLTDEGEHLLTGFGIDLKSLHGQRRPFLGYCLDWTEQAHHLAGSLGAAVTDRLFNLDWIRRTPTHRAVQLTAAGRAGLQETFDVTVTEDGMAASPTIG